MNDKQEYSLFWNDGWQPNDEYFYSGRLEAFIAEAAAEFGPPIAWASGYPRELGMDYEALRAESIAAGRLIEKTASGWVALGAEKQEEESELRWAEANAANPKNLIKRFTRVVDKPEVVGMSLSVAVAVIQSTPQFIGDGCWADAAMIARDGPARSALFLPAIAFGIDFAAVFPPAADTAKPNPFPTTLRSPDCDSGPSDHLNASRHQMAGMSKS